MRKLVALGLVTAAAFLASCTQTPPVPKADFYVAPTGDDRGAGKAAAPFRSLDQARLAVRRLKQSQRNRTEPIVVLLRGGTYALDKPVTFEPEDSGTDKAPVVYAAWPGEQPLLSGGVALRGFKIGAGERWQLTIPEVAAGQWYFSQLFVNGERRYRPRLPKEGYYFIAGEAPPTPKNAKEGDDRFRYPAGSFDPAWTNQSDVEVMTFHPWFTATFPIAALDAAQRIVTLGGHTRGFQGYTKLLAGNRFLVDNVAAALDTPGQWYLDRKTGVLTYLPRPGEKLDQATVIAPRAAMLVNFAGDPDKGRFVEHVELRGLTFAHTNWTMPADGYVSVQAAVTMPGAISGNGVRHCTITNCTVTQVGMYAIDLGAGCRDNRIERCTLTDLGGGGIKLGTTGYFADDNPRHTSGQVVRDTLIAHGGRIAAGAVGLWIGQSSRNLIEHNEICDLYYSGMSIGWTWGYGNSGAHDNLVQYNHIHHLGYGVLGDMGCVYTLGKSPGSVLRYNRMHDVVCFGYGGWGIYFDEGTTGFVAEKNLVYRCTDGNFHQHYGQENRLVNNILANATDNQLAMSRKEDHLSFTIERNIIAWKTGVLFRGNPEGFQIKLDRNLYWHDGKPLRFDKYALEEWQGKFGQDEHSLVADPMFADPAKDDFTLQSPGVAASIGFEPFDQELAKAGRRNAPGEAYDPASPRWRLVYPPPPGPQPIADDFEFTDVGQKPARAALHEENDQCIIRVTDETAASGKHSLKFIDGPGQKQSFNPHLYYQPGFKTGTVRGTFALRMESGGSTFNHEWRTGGNPYRTGPALNVRPNGELVVGGKVLAQLPLQQWVRFELTSAIGEQAAGTWDVTVTVPGQEPQRFAGLSCVKEFNQLSWVGFVAMGNEAGVFYVDDVKIEAK